MTQSFRNKCAPYWDAVQHELLPMKAIDMGGISPLLEQVIRVLEWVRVEEFVRDRIGQNMTEMGRPECDRAAMARAFCVKPLLGMSSTRALIERLTIDSKLRRICGFSANHKLPCEASFSRAFAQFTQHGVAMRAHEALVRESLAGHIIGAVSRDSTALPARERYQGKIAPCGAQAASELAAAAELPAQIACPPISSAVPLSTPTSKRGRGRPRKDAPKVIATAKPTRISRQRTQSLAQMLTELPTSCDSGSKTNAKGYKETWLGYKLHLDTTDSGITVSALTTSASLHDSQASIPLSRMSSQRVDYCYELADAAYCSAELRADAIAQGHVPLYDHNPRGGERREFEPYQAHWYNNRSGAERVNAQLKDSMGLRQIFVRGHAKVHSYVMFAILALSSQQLMRLLE